MIVEFPGGPAVIDPAYIERKLREFLIGRRMVTSCTETHWYVQLWVDGHCYDATSELGYWDAIANALQSAQGREEIADGSQ